MISIRQAVRMPYLYWRAESALRYAQRRGLPGSQFAKFGRSVGWRMLMRNARPSVSYLLSPVSITRYFEFEFTYQYIPSSFSDCLDVSSPSLFSFFVAHRFPNSRILMINPDSGDIAISRAVSEILGYTNIDLQTRTVEESAKKGTLFDCIWSISVVEHISGAYSDSDAMRDMYSALLPGGRLIVTIPVDRKLLDEFREDKPYDVSIRQSSGGYFFQRYYDTRAIRSRLLDPIGAEPAVMRWFGETTPGRFSSYEQRWRNTGYRCTVDDPKEIVDHYREYPSWEAMPGAGVCGLMIVKPAAANSRFVFE